MILGGDQADGIGLSLGPADRAMDGALAAVYDVRRNDGPRRGGLGKSMPSVARWLGDIREHFPKDVVRVLQRDALERLNLRQMLTEPEMLEAVEPDVHLVADLMSLSGMLPARAKEAARAVVRKCVDDLTRKLQQPMQEAVAGAINRSVRNRRPRLREIDWPRTIRANLRHYQPEYQTIVPETRIGFGRRRSGLKDVILCVDQSGSMAASVVYSGVFGAVLASLPAVKTSVVVFDTAVVDLTEKLDDPVDVLFGCQLGGGTDIHRAVSYCQGLVTRPHDTVMVLISDLYEGGVREKLLKRAASILSSGVTLVTLLALSDEGAPSYDARLAAELAQLGSPAFACTPTLFPDLMAAALTKQDLAQWAAAHEIQVAGAAGGGA